MFTAAGFLNCPLPLIFTVEGCLGCMLRLCLAYKGLLRSTEFSKSYARFFLTPKGCQNFERRRRRVLCPRLRRLRRHRPPFPTWRRCEATDPAGRCCLFVSRRPRPTRLPPRIRSQPPSRCAGAAWSVLSGAGIGPNPSCW